MNGDDRHPRLDDTLALLARIEFLRRELTAAREHAVWVARERGASVREVARVIDISPATVQNLYARHAHWPHVGPYCRGEPHS